MSSKSNVDFRVHIQLLVCIYILTGGFVACSPKTYINPSLSVEPALIIATAQSLKGIPYRYGGTTPQGFDCSGFIRYVFKQHKINIPRTTSRQARMGKKLRRKHLKKGDIVFFHTKGIITKPTHAGLYIGNNKFIHAGTSPPAEVRIDSFDTAYYSQRFLFGRRLLNP